MHRHFSLLLENAGRKPLKVERKHKSTEVKSTWCNLTEWRVSGGVRQSHVFGVGPETFTQNWYLMTWEWNSAIEYFLQNNFKSCCFKFLHSLLDIKAWIIIVHVHIWLFFKFLQTKSLISCTCIGTMSYDFFLFFFFSPSWYGKKPEFIKMSKQTNKKQKWKTCNKLSRRSSQWEPHPASRTRHVHVHVVMLWALLFYWQVILWNMSDTLC